MTTFKNLTFALHPETPQAFITFQVPTVHIENCEFISATVTTANDKARLTIKSCLFEGEVEETSAIHCARIGQLVVQDCAFHHCDTGVYFEKCNETAFGPNLIENCLFEDLIDSIYFDDHSSARTILKNNSIIRSERCGVYLEIDSAAEIVGCTIEECRTGIIVYENSKIVLKDNIIMNNEEYGVRIRQGVEIQQFKGNKIQHNGSGITMPRQDNPEYQEEELMKNNEISQNQFANLVLEEKKMMCETIYREGDSIDVMRDNIKLAIKRGLCTYSATVTNPVGQEWYECFTCKMGVCPVCAETCHEGHTVSVDSGIASTYCDCGAGSNCNALNEGPENE